MIEFAKFEVQRYITATFGNAPDRVVGGELRCPCPIHKGKGDNFAIQVETGRWFCHSQCGSGGDLIELEQRRSGRDFSEAATEVFRIVGRDTYTNGFHANGHSNGHSKKRELGPVIAEFDYVDELGKPQFQVRRHFPPKDFSQRHLDSKGKWVYNIDGVRRVLYRLPNVVKAELVFVAEGEKCVHSLESLSLIATCNSMGAGKWRDEYSDCLAGKDVIILPDNDEPGRDHAQKVARSLYGKARRVRLVGIPGLPPKGDIADWVDAGGDAEGLWALVNEVGIDYAPEGDAETRTVAEPCEDPKAILNDRSYPKPIGHEAYIGVAGRFVRAVEAHTEADPSLLLLLFLTYAGNLLGRNAYVQAGGDRHHSNLFLCAVGPTSSGRKGSAFPPVELFFERIDEEWLRSVQSGLSSGEGLIWCVRDTTTKRDKVSKKGQPDKFEETIVDAGVTDKRLLVRQSEFYGALQVMKRPGNTLSPTIRDAWDRGNLNSITKNSPARATGAHISIVANVTKEELLRGMQSDEMDNGFSNRFLWVCSKRSRELPEGGRLLEVVESAEFGEIVKSFNRIYGAVKGLVCRDQEAADQWGRDDKPGMGLYHELTRDRQGLFGLCTARAHAAVIRLSLIYALLDGSTVIRREHQNAAYECWRYCEDSALFVFGSTLADPIANRILDELKGAPDGLTRKDIYLLFAKNKSSSDIHRALTELQSAGLAHQFKVETGGRPTELWKIGRATQ